MGRGDTTNKTLILLSWINGNWTVYSLSGKQGIANLLYVASLWYISCEHQWFTWSNWWEGTQYWIKFCEVYVKFQFKNVNRIMGITWIISVVIVKKFTENWHCFGKKQVPPGTPVVNALSKQRAMLENILRACIGLAPENNMILEYKWRSWEKSGAKLWFLEL